MSDNTQEIKRPSRVMRIIGPILITIFSLACMLLTLEAYMRVGFDTLPPGVQGDIQGVRRVPWSEERIIQPIPFLSDSNYLARLEPGIVDHSVRWRDARFKFSTRAMWEGHPVGLRTHEPLWPLDLVAFGDSFTFCWTDVEDCWVQRLQSDYGYSVVNAGQPATGSGGQLKLMTEILEPIQAPLVVWQWYGNDLMDDYVLASYNGEAGGLEEPPGAIPVREPQGFERYSALYFMLNLYILDPPSYDGRFLEYVEVEANGREISVPSDEYAHGFSFSYPAIADGWERNVAHHMAAAEFVAELGVEMVIVIIPTKEEVYQAYIGDDLSPETYEDAGEGRRRLVALCQEQGWHCIDMLPYFQEAVEDGDTVYWAGDFHLDASGNLVVARVVNDYIIENELLPSD